MAGHSHWAGIKHKKDRADKIRSKIFSKLSREITVAAKLGDKDPDINPRLRSAIQSARSANMPKDNILRAIQKSEMNQTINFEAIRYEGFGPHRVACIVETLTDNKNRTASNIRTIFQKNAGSLGTQGSVSHSFDQKGVIKIRMDEINDNELYELAIEVGADECLTHDEIYEIHCKKNQIYEIKSKLEKKINNFISTDIDWLPKNLINLNVDQKNNVIEFLNMLEEDDDVQKFYINSDLKGL